MHGLSERTTVSRRHFGAAVPTKAGARRGLRVRARRSDSSIVLNVIPLVDITFLLMIFFVIAGTFNSLEGLLGAGLTPVRAGAGGPPVPFMPIVVRILSTGTASGTVSLEVEPSSARPATFAELTDVLHGIRQQPGFDNQTPVIVQADDGVLWDQAVEGWNAALRAGFFNLAYADPPSLADPLKP